jgi:putative ABC transport system permease protein
MLLRDYLEFAKSSLVHRKLRSWLTALGIVIGIAAVFSLVSIGQGFDNLVKEQISSLGGNFIFITPSTQTSQGGPSFGFSSGVGPRSASQGTLTTNDVSAVRSARGVVFADGIIFDRSDVEFRGEVVTTNVQGYTVDLLKEFPLVSIGEGRIFSSGESKVAIVGFKVARDFFDREVKLGDIITVEKESYRVIGIFSEGSGATASIFDQSIAVPRDDAKRMFKDPGSRDVSAIFVKMSEDADADRVLKDVEKRLRASHKVTKEDQDFTATSSKAIQSSVAAITGGITLFLGGIAAISLLVGAIGIVNTMFMSVMERTKQIGILKALGARSSQITAIFLIESSMLGLIGGVIGVSIGVALDLVIGSKELLGPSAFVAPITPGLVIFCISFSAIVGTVAGVLPARRAAKMDPVEAIRYE